MSTEESGSLARVEHLAEGECLELLSTKRVSRVAHTTRTVRSSCRSTTCSKTAWCCSGSHRSRGLRTGCATAPLRSRLTMSTKVPGPAGAFWSAATRNQI